MHHATAKASILYVDDDPQNLSSFKALFRREYNVFLAESAQAGLKILNHEKIQVLITDQRMPGMTGSQLLEVVATRFPKTQRFILTAYSDFNPLVDAINRGKLQGFFSKPIDDELIRKRIEEGLANYYLERKNQELMQRIQRNESFLTAVMENIPDIILVKDAETLKFVGTNMAAESLLGLDREEIIGKRVSDLLLEEDASECQRTDAQTLATCHMISIPEERVVTRQNQTHYLSTKKIPILDSEGRPVFILAVSRDITEQREQQAREKALQNQLIQAQKMEAIGTLAGGIAHDFNNILTLIMGYTELALDEVSADSHLADSLREVFIAGERGRDLVKQILTVSRQSDETLKPIKATKVATEVLKFISASIAKEIEIVRRFESDALILANPTQIHQVLINLCTNAAFAMQSKGGILEMCIAEVYLEASTQANSQQHLPPGAYLQITVSDNGSGIAPEHISTIFQPYFTTKQPGQGTGLGLAIVNGIVESHGGNITVCSEMGKGTQFTIHLPMIAEENETLMEAPEELTGGAEMILFIDDEPGITKMNIRALAKLGYQVTGYSDSLKALEFFQHHFDAVDLVITDLAMPQMSGDHLVSELINIRPDIPIILCSGYLGNRFDSQIRHSDIKAVLQKPIVFSDLARSVRRVLDENYI